MPEILTNEMMCASEIFAAAVACQADLMAMQEANHERDQQGHAHAYGPNHFFERSKELNDDVARHKAHYIGK